MKAVEYIMKIDRLLTILTILLKREQVTAPELAERLEVNRRTIGRDVEDLCKAGFPIITKQGSGGGISIDDCYKLDKNILTKDELENIIIGLKGLESVDPDKNIMRLLLKLNPEKERKITLNDSFIIDLASHYKDSLSEKLKILKSAISESRLVTFDYYSDKGLTSHSVEPYYVTFKWAHWYVFGYSRNRSDFRLFKLNRLWKLKITENIFSKGIIPSEKQDLGAFFTDEESVIILFDNTVEYLLVEEYGPDCYTKLTEGKLRFEGTYTNQEYIVRWILSFGSKAEVLEPEKLRNEIKEISKSIFQTYN